MWSRGVFRSDRVNAIHRRLLAARLSSQNSPGGVGERGPWVPHQYIVVTNQPCLSAQPRARGDAGSNPEWIHARILITVLALAVVVPLS